jgi:hypothetical protein
MMKVEISALGRQNIFVTYDLKILVCEDFFSKVVGNLPQNLVQIRIKVFIALVESGNARSHCIIILSSVKSRT